MLSKVPPVISSLFDYLSAPELATTIWEMYRLSQKVFNFDTFQNIFNILDIENGCFELDLPLILETHPFPFITYLKSSKSFVIVSAINERTISVWDNKEGFTEYPHSNFAKNWNNQILYFEQPSELRIPRIKLQALQKKINPINGNSLSFFLQDDTRLIPLGKIQTQALHHKEVLSFETVVGPFNNLLTLSIFSGDLERERLALDISSNQQFNVLQLYLGKAEDSALFQYLGVKGSLDRIFKIQYEN